jgi:hypothetical protein
VQPSVRALVLPSSGVWSVLNAFRVSVLQGPERDRKRQTEKESARARERERAIERQREGEGGRERPHECINIMYINASHIYIYVSIDR